MPATPLKLATLLFSGGLATLAVARASPTGCDGAAPPPPAAPRPPSTAVSTPKPLDFWGDNEVAPWPAYDPSTLQPDAWFYLYTLKRRLIDTPPSELAPSPAEELPDDYFGGAKSDGEVWRTRPREPAPIQHLGGARADPSPVPAPPKPELPANYFGGAKSDAEVWGDLTADDIARAYGLTGLQKVDTAKRARR